MTKKKRGRPEGSGTGESPVIPVRFPEGYIEKLEKYCEKKGITKSEAIRSATLKELRES